MNKKQYGVLAEMRKNSRITYSALAKKLRIPLSTAIEYERSLRGMKRDVMMPHFEKAGFPLRIFIAITCRDRMRDACTEFITGHPSVNTAYRTNEPCDFFVDAVFKTLTGMQDFIDSIEKYAKSKKVQFVISVLKIEAFFPEMTDENPEDFRHVRIPKRF